ncbi:hypothetical protein P8452_27709 [Trifolium repens]|nr:hypothetical protein P8452_27709 [Trifolium repens]
MAKYQTLMLNNPSQSNSWSSPSTVGGVRIAVAKNEGCWGRLERERERESLSGRVIVEMIAEVIVKAVLQQQQQQQQQQRSCPWNQLLGKLVYREEDG